MIFHGHAHYYLVAIVHPSDLRLSYLSIYYNNNEYILQAQL